MLAISVETETYALFEILIYPYFKGLTCTRSLKMGRRSSISLHWVTHLPTKNIQKEIKLEKWIRN